MPVLIAFDFSKPSRRALDEAASLARSRRTHLIVVHAFGRSPSLPPVDAVDPIAQLFIEGRLDEAERLTHDVLEPLRDGGLKVELVAQEGTVRHVLEQAIETTRPELVVVGHHSSGIRLGSVAKWVLDHADVPVLVVPEKD